ncbi:MAG: hypothetical protein WBA28_09335, partial [Microbacteriaceae bacterium]
GLKVTVEDSAEGKPFSFTVRDVDYSLSLGEEVTVPLADQGERHNLEQQTASNIRREDGSLLTATLPTLQVESDEERPPNTAAHVGMETETKRSQGVPDTL